VTFVPIGEARLDLYTDAMLLDIGRDTFVVPLARLADLTAHRRREVVVSRRYWGDVPGTFRDVELMMWTYRANRILQEGATMSDAVMRFLWFTAGFLLGSSRRRSGSCG